MKEKLTFAYTEFERENVRSDDDRQGKNNPFDKIISFLITIVRGLKNGSLLLYEYLLYADDSDYPICYFIVSPRRLIVIWYENHGFSQESIEDMVRWFPYDNFPKIMAPDSEELKKLLIELNEFCISGDHNRMIRTLQDLPKKFHAPATPLLFWLKSELENGEKKMHHECYQEGKDKKALINMIDLII